MMEQDIAQGYEKQKEKEEKIEKKYQEVVSRGKKLLNITLQNGCINYGIENSKNMIKVKLINGKVNVNVNSNCIKVNIESKVAVSDLGYGIFDLISKFDADCVSTNDQCIYLTNVYWCDDNECLDMYTNCVNDIDWDDYDGRNKLFIIDDRGETIIHCNAPYVVS